jgi:hypothetical protein
MSKPVVSPKLDTLIAEGRDVALETAAAALTARIAGFERWASVQARHQAEAPQDLPALAAVQEDIA